MFFHPEVQDIRIGEVEIEPLLRVRSNLSSPGIGVDAEVDGQVLKPLVVLHLEVHRDQGIEELRGGNANLVVGRRDQQAFDRLVGKFGSQRPVKGKKRRDGAGVGESERRLAGQMMNHRTPPGCAKVELAPLVLIKIPGAEAWVVAGSGGAQPALRQYPGERCPSLIGIDARKCVPGQAASEVGWLVVRIQKALFEEQMRVEQGDAYGKRAVGSDLVRQRGLKPIRLQRGARAGEAPYELRVGRVAV